MTDKILAIISISLFLVFVGFLAIWINEPDLWVVVVVVAGMALYDFWRTLRADGDAGKA
jgi:uncharacterized membrane protein YoaK (UPF0700 family)